MIPELEKKIRKELDEIFNNYSVLCKDVKIGGVVVVSADVIRKQLTNDLLLAINRYLNSHKQMGTGV